MKVWLVTIICMAVIFETREASGQNRPPERIRQIMDVHTREDANPNTLAHAQLSRIFIDPDGDTLDFSFVDPPDSLNLEIIRDDLLTYRIPRHFYTIGRIPVIVKASDPDLAVAYDTFTVQVDPTPDTLLSFHLISPPDNSNAPNDTMVTFVWTQAINVDLDPVRYIVFIERLNHDRLEFHAENATTADTPSHDLWLFGAEIHWWVWAYSAYDSVRSIETFTLFPPLDVPSDQLPAFDYQLSAFPNPFNSTTTIRFKSPHAIAGGVGGVSLRIYDISGRLVADLTQHLVIASLSLQARQSLVWDSGSVGAGVYFVRLDAGEEVRIKKIVLMR